MIRYLLYLIPNFLCSIMCYLTNWFVVLFADENGELPKIFRGWQTWDDSLDVDWFVEETVPKIFRYDFNSKYERYSEDASKTWGEYGVNRTKLCSRLKPGATFSIKERIQRYCCRVLWLTRNCAYGFSFLYFGALLDSKDVVYEEHSELYTYGYDKSKPWYSRPFIYKNDKNIISNIRWCLFFGWKLSGTIGKHNAMIANRIAIRF